jgi:hypothetical protein
VVVHEDQGAGRQFQRPADDLARVNRRVIHRADALQFLGDQPVLLVEEKNPEFLALARRHGGAAIVQDIDEGGQRATLLQLAARQAAGAGLNDFQFRYDRLTDAGDFHQPLRARRQHLGEGAKAGDQDLGQRLDVAPRHGAKQHQLQQLVIGDRVRARLAQALTQTVAMAVEMWRLIVIRHGQIKAAGQCRPLGESVKFS